MHTIVVDTVEQLSQFATSSKDFDSILFCDCEGERLGRIPESLTSIQIYDPKSNNGYYIDVLKLRKDCKEKLVRVLKTLFENKLRTFVFYDPTNDFIGINELGIEIAKIFCMKIACNTKSLQHLMETKSGLLPWDIYEWLLEKYESRKMFAKSDYSDILKRPLNESHIQMALKDAFYLHGVFQKEGLRNKLEDVVKITMKGLPGEIQIEKSKKRGPSRAPPKFEKTNLIVALRNDKLKWLACGYIGKTLIKGEPLSAKEMKHLKAAICQIHLSKFGAEIEKTLTKLYLTFLSDLNKSEKPKVASKVAENTTYIQVSESLEKVLQKLKLQNAGKNEVVDRQFEIIKKAIASIEIALNKNK